MYYWFQKWRRRIILALGLIGPGIITAVADNDAAGVSTYSMAAAEFGYQIFIILIPMTILLAVTQEIGGRIAIVAEKGLADLIRERYGVKTALFMYILLFCINLVVVVVDIAGLKSALALFGLNPSLFLPAIIAGLFLFVVLASYSVVERFFFLLMGFYLTYIASAFLAKPDWQLAVTSLVAPQGNITARFIYVAVAVVGTTITAWGQFFINSYVKDKRINAEHLKYNRFEVYAGAVVTDMLTFFMMVAIAATIYTNRIRITDATTAAMAIQPFAGQFASVLFGVGLLFAGMLGCVVVAMTTAYAFSEFFGYSGSLDENFRQSKLFYVTLLLQLALGTIVVLLPNINLFTITLIANFMNGLVLPVIFYFLYQFANTESIMGKHVNSAWQNTLLVGSGIVITFAALFGVVGQLMGW